MVVTRAKRTAEPTDAVPARLETARELRKGVYLLPWGPRPARDAQREVHALRVAIDSLIRAEVIQRRAGAPATPAHREACRLAVDRIWDAAGALAGVVGARFMWVFRTLHVVDRAEAATDPVKCAVLDEHIHSAQRTLMSLQLLERGRSEALEPYTEQRRRAGRQSKRNPQTWARVRELVAGNPTATVSDLWESFPSYRHVGLDDTLIYRDDEERLVEIDDTTGRERRALTIKSFARYVTDAKKDLRRAQ
jgi:hypothetical protein